MKFCVCFLLALPAIYGLIAPLTNPDGSADLASIVSHVAMLEETVSSYQTKTLQLETAVQAATTAVNSLKNSHGFKTQDIAFRVSFTGKGTSTVGRFGRFLFNNIHYNAGNGYNTTGFFTAPVSGTYTFTAQIDVLRVNTSQYLNFDIMQGNTILSRASGQTSSVLWDRTATATAITYMKNGEQVWVQADDEGVVYISESGDTLFTGALLTAH